MDIITTSKNKMYFNTLLYSFMIEIIITKAHVKNINIRMLKSTCVDECHSYQFAICFPGSCSPILNLQTMKAATHCFTNLNKTNKYIAKVKEPELINNVTFLPIHTPISRLDTMVLMEYDTDVGPSTTKFIFCEKSRNLTKNGINVTFVDYGTSDHDSTMSFEILIEAVCEKEDCHGEMCDICGTTTELLATTDISTSTETTTHLSIETTHSAEQTENTTRFTTIQITNISESTTHENTRSGVTSTSATTTQLLPTTNISSSGETTTRLSTQTTYSTGYYRPTPTKQDEKITESTTHSTTKTDVASTTHLPTSTMNSRTKSTHNATTPVVSKNSTSQISKSTEKVSTTNVTKPTMFIKYVDSTIPPSRAVTNSSTNSSLSNHEEVENSKNVKVWAITTTAVGIVEMIIIVLLIVYIRWLKIQMRTASSSQEFCSQL